FAFLLALAPRLVLRRAKAYPLLITPPPSPAQDRPSYESYDIPEVDEACWACPSYWRTRKAVMRARVKAGVRYLLVPHTARPGGATSFVVSVTSKEEIRLSPPLAPWIKLAAPVVDWPLGARASDGTRAADWRNAPQISLVNTSGAPCAAVVVLTCGKQSGIAGGVPLQLLQLQVAHNSTAANRRYVDRLTRSAVLQSKRAAAYEGGAFSFVTLALTLAPFERTRLIALGPSVLAESSTPHLSAQLQLSLYCEDDCVEVPEPPAEWHAQTWVASPADLDKEGALEVEVRALNLLSAPAAAVLIAELLVDGKAASDGSGVTISLRAREGVVLLPGATLPSAESATSLMLPPSGAARQGVVRAVLNSGLAAHRAQLRVHICSAVPAQVTMTCATRQPQPTLACVENAGLGTPLLQMSEGAAAASATLSDDADAALAAPVLSRKYEVAVVTRVAEQLLEQRDHLQRFIREQLRAEPPGALLAELSERIRALERELASAVRSAAQPAGSVPQQGVRKDSSAMRVDANEESRTAMLSASARRRRSSSEGGGERGGRDAAQAAANAAAPTPPHSKHQALVAGQLPPLRSSRDSSARNSRGAISHLPRQIGGKGLSPREVPPLPDGGSERRPPLPPLVRIDSQQRPATADKAQRVASADRAKKGNDDSHLGLKKPKAEQIRSSAANAAGGGSKACVLM
ncbi:hypothetical protein T492DRAFT_147036, partial [Pavlovales sp. CCMP2436]